ncbi:hypothetical protein IWW48_003353 [Coemansia sp. RSA 1200]|nr:hypothetical protein IWW48_003353 [Coemansia sp. RSA 1200]
MADDDDENFELVDYTAASSWEKFIASIEIKLSTWKLGDGGAGEFDLEELAKKCQSLIVRHRQYRESVLSEISDLCTRTARLVYRGTAYAMVLSVHPLLADDTAMQKGDGKTLALFDSQFPRIHAPELEVDHSQKTPEPAWHPLHRWTGSRMVIYLRYLGDDRHWGAESVVDVDPTMDSANDYYSVSLETAKMLMSSMNIAVQNARCHVPVFVPVGDAWRCLFTGRSLGRAALSANSALPSKSVAVAVVRKFESVFLPQAPSAYLQLSGLLELFSNSFRVLAHAPQSFSSSQESITATATVSSFVENEWEFILNTVSLAALHTYHIKSTYNRVWNTASSDFYYRAGDLNVGPATDPLRLLKLSALFQRSSCNTYIDLQNGGRDRLYLKTATAWLLSAQMLPADRERTMLVEALEDAFAAWAQSSNDANRHRHLSLSEQMEAHAEITSDMLIALFGPSKALHITPPGLDAEAKDEAAAMDVEKRLEDTFAEMYYDTKDTTTKKPPTVAQLVARMPHGTAVPQNSLLWRLSEILLVSTAKRSADFWGAPSIMTFLRLLWAMALKEIRWRWENGKVIPRVPLAADYVKDGEDSNSGISTPMSASASGNGQPEGMQEGTTHFAIHLKYALAHQKLEMLNCCLERKLLAEGAPTPIPLSASGTSFRAGSTGEANESQDVLFDDNSNLGSDNDGLAQRIRSHVKSQIRRRIGDAGAEIGQKAWAQGSRIRRPLGRLLSSIRTQRTPGNDDSSIQTSSDDVDGFEEIQADNYDSGSEGFVSAEDVDYDDEIANGDQDEDYEDRGICSDLLVSEDDGDSAQLLDQMNIDADSSIHYSTIPARLPINAVRKNSGDGTPSVNTTAIYKGARDNSSSAYVDLAISSSLDSTSGFHHVSNVFESERPSVMSGGTESTESPTTMRANSSDTKESCADADKQARGSDADTEAPLAQDERKGGLYPSKTLHLLKTAQPLWIPKIQMHPVMTEDMLREREAILMSFGTSAEGAQQRAQLQCAELISDMESFKAANPDCELADFVRWHSPRDWIVPDGASEEEGRLSMRMSSGGGGEEDNLWQQLWAQARRLPADKQKPLFDYEMEAEKALHYLEGIPVYSLFSGLLPAIFLISYERLYRQPVIHRIGCLRERLEGLGNKIAVKVDWSTVDPESPVYSSIMDDLEDLEIQTSRCVSLLYKFPGQYRLVEALVDGGQAVVDDRNVQKAVFKALSKHSNIMAASPESREYVFSAGLSGVAPMDADTGTDTRQRMHVSIEENKTIRVVYGRAKVQGTTMFK